MPAKNSAARGISPIKTLLVPTDFSRNAEKALERALLLPLAADAKLHLLHVLADTLFDAQSGKHRSAAAAAMERAVSHAGKLARKRRVGITITGSVVFGRPFEHIVRQSRLLGAELIVLGRHGSRHVRDLFLGTTADRVVRYGDVPVLVVGGPVRHAYQRPAAAVDFGETTRETLTTLLRVVGPEVDGITLVHAYDTPFRGPIAVSSTREGNVDYRKAARARVAEDCEARLANLPRWGVTWRKLLVLGDPRGAVSRTARRCRADVIALGTHARRGLSRWPIGSVAEWVVARAPCDVLIARPARFTFEPLV